MTFAPFTAKTPETIARELRTDVNAGLSAREAQTRLDADGPNTVALVQTSGWQIFFRQFRSPFVWLLVAAAGIAVFLGEVIDGGMILLFVAINAFLGWYQEWKSAHTLTSLKTYLEARARVRRGGHDVDVPSRDLVVGDMVMLEAGDRVPADIRLTLTAAFSVDESALSGESVPVDKQPHALREPAADIYRASNMAFEGTTVVAGHAQGVVVATGARTAFGEAAKLSVETHRESTFEKGIARFSAFILRQVLITIVIVFVVNLILDRGGTSSGDLFIFSVALAVSVIPEALPTVMTFSLSRGAMRLAKRKVVVKRLAAIEDLGSIEVLCSDKTGTLTENILAVANVFGNDPREVLRHAAMAVTYTGRDQHPKDPFDAAICDALSADERRANHALTRPANLPFDPARRRNSYLVVDGQTRMLVVRGAIESILPCIARMSERERERLLTWAANEGRLGRRTIMIAAKRFTGSTYGPEDESHGLHIVGALAFTDPIKPTTRETVRRAEQLGVRIKVLTGDSREVAGAVAFEVGLVEDPSHVMTGDEFEALSTQGQHTAAHTVHVFARVTPQQKHRIIQLLSESVEVGFLGEGINDAPALKAAGVAIVVQGASDVAREAADIVLLKQGLDVIVDGIKEGREVFANTVKYIQATLTSNFGNFYALAIATLFIDYLPMLPLQILLLNLLSDFPMIAIAADRVDHGELTRPRHYDVSRLVLIATVLGLVSTVFDFLYFAIFQPMGPQVLQTNWFIGSIVTELVLIYSIRTKLPFWRSQRPSGVLIVLSVVAAVFAVAIPFLPWTANVFGFMPPTPMHLAIIFGLAAAYFVMTEIVKLTYMRFVGAKIK